MLFQTFLIFKGLRQFDRTVNEKPIKIVFWLKKFYSGPHKWVFSCFIQIHTFHANHLPFWSKKTGTITTGYNGQSLSNNPSACRYFNYIWCLIQQEPVIYVDKKHFCLSMQSSLNRYLFIIVNIIKYQPCLFNKPYCTRPHRPVVFVMTHVPFSIM